MSPTPRRIRNTPHELGIFKATGSLRDLVPGRDPVRDLTVGQKAETLEPLAAFPDLRRLRLERLQAVDLSPLAALRLDSLSCIDLQAVDLAPLANVDGLSRLLVVGSRDCAVPEQLVLPSSLRWLQVASVGGSADDLSRLLAAIDWCALRDLGTLVVMADPAPAVADLSLVRWLPNLRSLSVGGVRHSGRGLSPLRPPFDWLPSSLERIAIEAADRVAVDAALRERYPGAEIAVNQWDEPEPGDGVAWTVHAPDEGESDWSTYGSICELAAFHGCDTEYDAARAAEVLIREQDLGLAQRLDFDEEADGTGIAASTRDDLEAALRIIGAIAN